MRIWADDSLLYFAYINIVLSLLVRLPATMGSNAGAANLRDTRHSDNIFLCCWTNGATDATDYMNDRPTIYGYPTREQYTWMRCRRRRVAKGDKKETKKKRSMKFHTNTCVAQQEHADRRWIEVVNKRTTRKVRFSFGTTAFSTARMRQRSWNFSNSFAQHLGVLNTRTQFSYRSARVLLTRAARWPNIVPKNARSMSSMYTYIRYIT